MVLSGGGNAGKVGETMANFELFMNGNGLHIFSAVDIFEAQSLTLCWASYQNNLREDLDVRPYSGSMKPMADEFMNRWRKDAQFDAKRFRSGKAKFRQ
jgi:hypothetical protein